MAEQKLPVEVTGKVLSIVYTSPESGYTVLRLEVPEQGEIHVVGTIPQAAPGEELELLGEWVRHPVHGEQFRADQVRRAMPVGENGILRYLASGAIRGIGPATARRMVERFGDRALEILESEPERLAELRGISLRKAREMGEEFRQRTGLRRLMEFLSSWQIPLQLAARLYRDWGDEALERLREDPYLLTEEEYGVSFAKADAMALGLGIPGDGSRRMEAAVLFELSHNLGNGHVFLPRGKLILATVQLLDGEREPVEEALDALEEQGRICLENIAGQEACYLDRYHEAERVVAARIAALADDPPEGGGDWERALELSQRQLGVDYAPAQREALQAAAEHRLLLLTGGPGTGKTTTTRGIVLLLEQMGLRVALAAPTGRAAKRMGELCGREALTIHRLLEAGVDSATGEMCFARDEDRPLEADAVIVDESSMMDLLLTESLLRAMGEDCRLILVGDPDQLPAVGAGNVLSDLLRSGRVRTVALTEVFRQARESAIVMGAHRVNRGELPDLSNGSRDLFWMRRGTPVRAAETVVELCSRRLPEGMGVEPWQIQVLSPTRKGEAGVEALNVRLQAALNPPAPGKSEKKAGNTIFRVGDRVMQIRNNYDILWKREDGLGVGQGVFNGDIGRVEAVGAPGEGIVVRFDDRLVDYPEEWLSELDLAYAMTVHKAQGSEYRAVVLVLSQSAKSLQTRGLLYTAITRARELLVLVGQEDILAAMAANDRQQRRYSGLRARLKLE